jgi:hypothetical protein
VGFSRLVDGAVEVGDGFNPAPDVAGVLAGPDIVVEGAGEEDTDGDTGDAGVAAGDALVQPANKADNKQVSVIINIIFFIILI